MKYFYLFIKKKFPKLNSDILALVAIASLLLCSTENVQAQSTANYTFSSATNGSLTDMSSGTTTLIAPTSTLADNASAVTNIGFDFWFMGTRYTQFSGNCNGLIRLGGTVVTTDYTNDLNQTTDLPIITAFWDDFGCADPIIAKVHYKVTGSAPNRVLNIEWKDFLFVYNATAGSTSTFQVRLYEYTGAIEYVYGAMNNATTTSNTTASIGFTIGNADNSLLSVTDISTPAVTVLAASVNDALVNNSTDGAIPGLNSDAEGSRTIYTFSQTAPTAPTGLTFTNIATTSITLNWTDNASNECGYVIYTSTDNVTFTFNQQVAAGSVTASVTGLTANTVYYFQVYAVREGALSTPLTDSQLTSTAYTYSSSGSLVIPCGVTSVVVETWGAGGGGGSSNNGTANGGSGGGGGAYAKGSHSVTAGNTYYYNVGTVGAGGPASSTTAPTAGGS
ncbi:MAG: fibronectin type III domain-containing protein, partial [Bacteroidia bacterium]|nr:fibronectin type III domain-containing protein [Bacteroidia bacterium]